MIGQRHLERRTLIQKFETLGVAGPLLRAVRDLGYNDPTPVQREAIPPALAGRDLLVSAETGSGKTAAFGLPIVQHLAQSARGTTRALVLAPTRELAIQIAQQLTLFARFADVRVAAVYGGVGFGPQVTAFARGTDIIVATPGRLLDHLGRGTASLANVSLLVLDEADRMLEMGFLPDVRRILKHVPAKRQTLCFSATLPTEIIRLAQGMLKDPFRVNLAPKAAPVASLTQTVYSVDQLGKTDLLVELLKSNEIYSALAFTRTKSRANRLAAALGKSKVSAERIHGDRSQSQRNRALEDFKRGKFRVLVATDIAARGIDILDLGHVINFDVPAIPEDYVHRIGRTARGERTGEAITFVSPAEEPLFRDIESALGKRLTRAAKPFASAADDASRRAPVIEAPARHGAGAAPRRKGSRTPFRHSPSA